MGDAAGIGTADRGWRLADRHTARGLSTGDDAGNGTAVGAGVGAAVGDGIDTAAGDIGAERDTAFGTESGTSAVSSCQEMSMKLLSPSRARKTRDEREATISEDPAPSALEVA